MKVSWKRTLIWLAAALALLFIPMISILGIYAAMVFICYLAASITTTVKKDARPYIPYSAAAVIQAILVTMWCCSNMEDYDFGSLMLAGNVMFMIFYVPFLLIMAAIVYFGGRSSDKKECSCMEQNKEETL